MFERSHGRAVPNVRIGPAMRASDWKVRNEESFRGKLAVH